MLRQSRSSFPSTLGCFLKSPQPYRQARHVAIDGAGAVQAGETGRVVRQRRPRLHLGLDARAYVRGPDITVVYR